MQQSFVACATLSSVENIEPVILLTEPRGDRLALAAMGIDFTALMQRTIGVAASGLLARQD